MEATVNNEQLRREIDQLKAENEVIKDESKQLKTDIDVLKSKNQQLTSQQTKLNADNESNMQQINVQSNKITQLKTEVHQMKVSIAQ